MQSVKQGKAVTVLLISATLVTAAILGLSFYLSSSTIHSLLTENHELNKAIRNLTAEEQIGYATLLSQSTDALGRKTSLVRFVQTAPGNPDQVVSEQIFPIDGDVVHFDALIVKFSDEFVKDGKERALYLWRRIYGEGTAPIDGEPIQSQGEAPDRYRAITNSIKLKNQSVFWESIWELANDPKHLSQYGVTAVFGNAIYTKMQEGRVYLFKINASGQIYPDLVYFD